VTWERVTMVFDAKAWEWNKDSLMIMEMQAAEL
jgi:hypothetical protein